MSSRILRPETDLPVEPVAWRPAFDTGLQPARHPGSPPGAAPAHPEGRLRQMEQEAQARLEQVRQAAFAQGQASAAEQAAARLQPFLDDLARMTAELAGLRRRFRAEAEEDVVRLSLAIARRILHRELSTDPEALLGLVKAAFEKVDARETHRLRVSPEDAALLEQHRAKLDFPPRLEIVPDPGLARASAVFETSRGHLDASVGAQLDEIERGFADLVRRSR